MASSRPGPLTDADLEEIIRQLENLKAAELEIERATRAGLDVSEQRKKAQELRTQLTRIKQTYFTGR